jgi:hypothetical protein
MQRAAKRSIGHLADHLDAVSTTHFGKRPAKLGCKK